jgi:divinyl protochlorophyllide a 8-vinyl-reductase
MRPDDPTLVGPNAVIQLATAMDMAGAKRLADDVFQSAGHAAWRARPPEEMIPEADVRAIHAALWRIAPPDLAIRLVTDAGWRTADYVIRNRMPAVVRRMLDLLPAPLADRVLRRAISRHAWTFAGSGLFVADGRTLVIYGNPLAQPQGCIWHAAVFTRFWQRLVDPRADVRELTCLGRGDGACRFRRVDGTGSAAPG